MFFVLQTFMPRTIDVVRHRSSKKKASKKSTASKKSKKGSKKGSKKNTGSKKSHPTFSKSAQYVINPSTGKPVVVGGKRYNELREQGILRGKNKVVSKGHATTKRHGNSKAARHAREGIPAKEFCGKAGGGRATSYPVDTPGRRRAALAYSRFAKNPTKLRECVHRAIARAQKRGEAY